MGGTAGVGSLLHGQSNMFSGREGAPGLQDFRVQGTYIERWHYNPDSIEIETRKISPDLQHRYGTNQLVSVQEFPKEGSGRNLPSSGTTEVDTDWDGLIATEDEWREYFESQAGDDGEVGAAVGGGSVDAEELSGHREPFDEHEDDEENHPYAFWIYDEEEDDDGNDYYESTSPINVIAPLRNTCKDLDGFLEELDEDGWVTGWIAEYARYAWNREDGEFQEQHDSAGTGVWRENGGHHIRCWEWEHSAADEGGWVSIQAHWDTSVPHAAGGYECTKANIEGTFEDALGWNVYSDYYDLHGAYGDPTDDCVDNSGAYHNGYASAITWGRCQNVTGDGSEDDNATGTDRCA